MAVDTKYKRLSAFQLLLPHSSRTTFPDGTIALADRQAVGLVYSGIATIRELDGYANTETLTVDASPYISSDLSDLPVVVHIDSSYTTFWANDDGDGTFVRFALADDTQLKFEVESNHQEY